MKLSPTFEKSARSRVIIESISPSVDQGRYAVKRTEGEWLEVQGRCVYGWTRLGACCSFVPHRRLKKVERNAMHSIGNDRWSAALPCNELGHFEYAVKAFIDHPLTWKSDFPKRVAANDPKEVEVQLQIGIAHVEAIQKKYTKARAAAKKMDCGIGFSRGCASSYQRRFRYVYGPVSARNFPLRKVRFFPMWCTARRPVLVHGILFFRAAQPKKVRPTALLTIVSICFHASKNWVLMLFISHPFTPLEMPSEKGKTTLSIFNPESPVVLMPQALERAGTKTFFRNWERLNDFIRFIEKARELDLEVAMDFAIQCSPDHPYVKEHPQWFKWRPDGSVQYAENPPKKYQDVLPLDFECEDYKAMWAELKSILEYWISKGISIFRVDNPHTKSFVFWEWCLEEIDREFPEVIFLAEAFTRPAHHGKFGQKGLPSKLYLLHVAQ
jgi:starch synthase (maltosyl-transferring)